jgi:sortase A
VANRYAIIPNPYESSLPRRGRLRRMLLGIAEMLCWILAIAALGWFCYVHANTYFFQEDQNRRMDALLRRSAMPALPAAGPNATAAPNSPNAAAPGSPSDVTPPTIPPKTYYAAPGDLIGRIEIPRLQLSAVVIEGVDSNTLRHAVGHIPGTALPGEIGNIALAAHRDSFFRKLGRLHDGDEIVLATAHGTFNYHVAHIGIVTPSDTTVLAQSDQPALTLVTCFPFRFIGPAPDRYIVTAR